MRHLAQSLLMSTAEPGYDASTKSWYSILKQGAGLANIGNAVKSGAYIAVEGTDKAKLELGDDADPAPTYPMNGLLLDEESGDAEEQRRRIEARIAAENFGAVVGLAAGVVIVAKEKHDEHAAQKEQEEQSHGQTMGGL